MKFYSSLDRSPSFGLADRLSRLLTFDFRAQFSVESGADFLVSLIVFGQGLTLGFTRGMPHIVGGVYAEVNILTERFSATAGFQSQWYDEYLNGEPLGIDIEALEESGDFAIKSVTLPPGGEVVLEKRTSGACVDGCCSHEDVAECHDDPENPANTMAGDLPVKHCTVARHVDIGCSPDCPNRV